MNEARTNFLTDEQMAVIVATGEKLSRVLDESDLPDIIIAGILRIVAQEYETFIPPVASFPLPPEMGKFLSEMIKAEKK